MDLIATVSGLLGSLQGELTGAYVEHQIVDFMDRRRVGRALEKALDEVTVELARFLENEVPKSEHREMLVRECGRALKPVLAEPGRLFEGSLDGQRIFDQLYPDAASFPEAIRHEALGQAWTLFVPRVAATICGVATSLRDWQLEAWREGYRRLDDLVAQLRKVQQDVGALAERPARESDRLLQDALRLRRQRRGLRAELGGLGDRQGDADLEAMFVFPELREELKESEQQQRRQREARVVGQGDQALSTFLGERARAVVVAGPGAGKTTWTIWMERHGEAAPARRLVLRVALREHAAAYPSIYELIRSAVGQHLAEAVTAQVARSWMNSGLVHVLVDGLDELTPERRDHALEWILGLSDAIGRGAMVVTSRPLATGHLGELGVAGFAHFDINPFDQDRISSYIQRWYEHCPFIADAERKADASLLADTWTSDPTLSELTGNPLLLGTLLTVHQMEGRLPTGRAKLYEKYVNGMLGAWDSRRKIEAPRVKLDGVSRRRVLRDLALAMIQRGVDSIEDDEVLGVVSKTLKNQSVNASSEDVLSDLRERSGLLVGPGTWSFAHKTIGEFLFAEAVVDGVQTNLDGQRIDRHWLLKRKHEDRFNVITFLWAGLVPTADLEDELQTLLTGDTEDLSLALGIVGDQIERLSPSLLRNVGRHLGGLPSLATTNPQWIAPYNDDGFPYEEFSLRSVQDNGPDSVDLTLNLRSRGYVFWDEAVDGGHVRRILWLLDVNSPWIDNVIRAPPFPDDEVVRWDLILAYFHFRHLTRTGKEINPEVLDWIRAIPRASSYMPLLIIQTILEGGVAAPGVDSMLIELSKYAVSSGDKRWLRKSHSVIIVGPGRVRTCDTLREVIPLFTARALALPPDVLSACSAHVEQLLTQRAALPPQPAGAAYLDVEELFGNT